MINISYFSYIIIQYKSTWVLYLLLKKLAWDFKAGSTKIIKAFKWYRPRMIE